MSNTNAKLTDFKVLIFDVYGTLVVSTLLSVLHLPFPTPAMTSLRCYLGLGNGSLYCHPAPPLPVPILC